MKFFLLLEPDGLSFYIKNTQSRKIIFPPEAILHQQIVNQKIFEEYLRKYFSYFSKQEALLFLSNEIVFSKVIPLQKNTDPDSELKEFIDIVPISSFARQEKIIKRKNAIYFLATNGEIYKTIIAIAEKYGCRIKQVVPLRVFGAITENQQLTYNVLNRLEKEKDLLKIGDFLQQEQQKEKNQQVPFKQVLIIFVCLSILAAVGLWGAASMGLLPIKQSTTQPTAVPTTQPAAKATPTLTVAPTATPSAVKKEEIKIQVFNGSGVAGQAGQIKNQLADIGFTNVQIGNAEGPAANTTIVIFAKDIPKAYKDSILEELEKTFNAVDTQEISKSNDFDVVITTGEVK